MGIPQAIRSLWPSGLAARLALLVVFTAAMSVSIAAGSMLFMAWKSAEYGAMSNARRDARSIAFSLAAPLAFSDRAGTREVVVMVSRRPDVQAIWVTDANGELLYNYGTQGDVVPLHESGSLREGQIVVAEPVRAGRGGDVVGRVALRIDLSGAQAELRSQAAAAGLASMLALALTVVLSRQMARRISVPMVGLARAADALTRDWSHPIRLDVGGPDEIGRAMAAYNHLVDELGRRDAALQKLTDELRDAAAAADAARQQAESASVAKTRFLANMSHELRSPLNGVIGAAQLLRKSDRDPVFREELIRIIQTSGTNLLELIEGVLDVSRIEAGRVQTEKQPFDLLQCLEAALAPAVAGATVKGLDLECQIDPDVPAWCIGDASRLKQLLQNLLGNAVKFTDSGMVSLAVSRDAGQSRLCFRVTDSGVGIPQHLQKSIFEPFQQGDPSATRRFGGSGLGLAICRDVARIMQGDVQVESTPGAGSCFTLSLPLPAVAHASGPPVQVRMQVRCYEPVVARRRSLAALLQRLGCRVQFCDDLAAVQATVKQAQVSGSCNDAWLIAVDVPDGAAAVQTVGGSGRIAVLGKCGQDLGAVHSLSRPLTLSTLRAFLTADEADAQTGALSDTMRRRMVRARVLLVEDDPVNRLVVRSMVDGKDFQCVSASSGAEALQRLAADRFDAVLMDWQMPDMDGLEVTRHLRAGICGELNRVVPVIALTANAFAEDRKACLAAGMNDFLTKPVQTQVLLQCLQRWCRSSSEAELTVVTRTVAVPVTVPSGQGSAPAYEPGVLAALHSDADGIQELLQLFLMTARASLPQMHSFVATADWRALQRYAHTLKSSSGQVGAMALSRLAAALESRLRAGEQGTATDVTELDDALAHFAAAAGIVAAAA
jgi:signal transduction histidine kinase/CheY-like chemotaxis protein/HPt (histidine-containing phosphotransfer) domain-containing protein